jgi:hypothetical protein
MIKVSWRSFDRGRAAKYPRSRLSVPHRLHVFAAATEAGKTPIFDRDFAFDHLMNSTRYAAKILLIKPCSENLCSAAEAMAAPKA